MFYYIKVYFEKYFMGFYCYCWNNPSVYAKNKTIVTNFIKSKLAIKYRKGVEILKELKNFDFFMQELSNKLLNGEIFENESQRKRVFYDSLKKMNTDWGTKKKCMYPGCKDITILNSHTIQEKGPLKIIAEGNNQDTVLTSEVKSGKSQIKEVKIAKSSTFPGFCSEHEKVFKEFEEKKIIENEIDESLQVFRTICRHLYMLKHRHKHLVSSINENSKRKLEIAKNLLNEYTPIPIQIQGNIKSVKDQNDEIEEKIRLELEQFIKDAQALYNASVVDLINKKNEELYIESILIEGNLFPVCLSGVGNLMWNRNGESLNISVIMNILPQENGTLLMAAVHKEYADDLNKYLDVFCSTELGIINLIESWMIHGTDHWFIRPSVWAKIPEERQKKILGELDKVNKSIKSQCPYSILDDSRNKAIMNVERILESEREKVTQDN